MKHHLRYLAQCARWKWYVFRAGLHTGAPIWRLVGHDLGRLRPAVWGPFARYLYGPTANPQQWMADYLQREHRTTVLNATLHQEQFAKTAYTDARKALEAPFHKAQLILAHANRADWPWWILRDEKRPTPATLEMPAPLARVMVASWIASGRDQSGKWEGVSDGTRRFYAHRRENIRLHSKTRKLVEEILNGLRLGEPKKEKADG